MLKIELYEYGLENTLSQINNELRSVLGKAHSKNKKDKKICEVIGMVDVLYSTIVVSKVDDADEKNESDE